MVEFGPARNDAFGVIFNQALGTFIDKPENIRPADAPVKYPILWDASFHDQVQWVGIARNDPERGGSFSRNVGQVLGVFGHTDVYTPTYINGYCTSAKRDELKLQEDWIKELRSPSWPVEVFGLDKAKAEKGRKIFESKCLSCHTDNKRSFDNSSAHKQYLGIDHKED